MARARARKDNTAMFLLLAGGAVAAYAIWRSTQRGVLPAGSSGTYQYPSLTNVANSFLSSIKSLFGGSSTTGIRTEAIWYDYESAIGKYPPARYPAYWQRNAVTGSLEFVGPRDIDIMLPAA
ncbi:hypothetical protein EBZ80_07160 [bacterium]|nr:hypothetical protein [bacterium]